MKLNTTALRQGKLSKGSSALSMVELSNTTSFISYNTKIAERQGNNLLVNPVKYSATTSKQLTMLIRYFKKQGLNVINWDTGDSM